MYTYFEVHLRVAMRRIRQHMSVYVSRRQPTSAHASTRQRTWGSRCDAVLMPSWIQTALSDACYAVVLSLVMLVAKPNAVMDPDRGLGYLLCGLVSAT